MPSYAVLDAVFRGAASESPLQDVARVARSMPTGKFPILENPETFRRVVRDGIPGACQAAMAALKGAAPHWQQETTAPRNRDGLTAVVQHLRKSGISQELADYLGEDLVRQHSFNCQLAKDFSWTATRNQVEHLRNVAEASRTAMAVALEACNSQALSALSEGWQGHPNQLSLAVLVQDIKGQRMAVRPDALDWLENLQSTAESVLQKCPKIGGGSITALSDKDDGISRRWLILNAQALLYCLGLPSGNSIGGPLARFVGFVDLASRSPAYQRRSNREERLSHLAAPDWTTRLVNEMRKGKAQP